MYKYLLICFLLVFDWCSAQDLELDTNLDDPEIQQREALLQQGLQFYTEKNLDSAYYYLVRYSENFDEEGMMKSISRKSLEEQRSIYKVFAKVFQVSNELVEAEKYAVLYLQLVEKTEDPKIIFKAKNQLASILFNSGEYEKTQEIFEQMLEIAQKTKDSSRLKAVYNNLGAIYYEQNKDAEALRYTLKSLTYAVPGSVEYYQGLYNINAMKMHLNRIEGMEESYKEILAFARQQYEKDEKEGIAFLTKTEHALGFFYQKIGKDYLARPYYERSLKYANLNEDISDEGVALESLVELSLNKRDQSFFQRYKDVQQELESQDQQSIEDLYHLKYDTEKKNAELQRQAYTLKIAEEEYLLVQNRAKYAILGFGLVLIAAILAVLFLKSEITKQTLASKLEKLEALYEDRNYISKHLHDEIASDIAVMTQKLDGQPEVKEHMHNVRIKIRDLSRNLNTTDFGDLVFSDMVKNLVVDLFGAKTKVHLYGLQIIDDLEIYPEGFKKAVYLIIKEALLNIDQHAQAQQITVQIEQEEQQFVVRVQDNGIGFDNNRTRRGIGLRNIKNRAEDLGGSVSVVSEVGVGTSLTCVCPLGKEQTIA